MNRKFEYDTLRSKKMTAFAIKINYKKELTD